MDILKSRSKRDRTGHPYRVVSLSVPVQMGQVRDMSRLSRYVPMSRQMVLA